MNELNKPKLKERLKKHLVMTSHAIGVSPTQVFVSALLLFGVGFLILYLSLSGKTSIEVVSASESNLREQTGLDQQLQELLIREVSDSNNILISISDMQDTETETTELEASHSLTPSQEEMVARIRLKNKGEGWLLRIRGKMDHDTERADLIRFCKAYCDVDKSAIRDESRGWLCALPAIDLVDEPSQETLRKFTDVVEQYKDCYVDSPQQANRLTAILVKSLNKPKPYKQPEIVRKAARDFAQHLLGSDTSGARSAGEQLVLLSIFSQYELKTLDSRVAWNEPSAPADLEGAITALSQNIDITTEYIWGLIINSYESHLANGEVEKVGKLWQHVSTLSQQIQSEETKTLVETKLRLQKNRAMLIGTTFDFSGARLNSGKPVDFGDYDYVAIAFCDAKPKSFELNKKIISAGKLNPPSFFSVVAFKQKVFDDQAIEQIDNSRGDFAILDADSARLYHEKLSIDTVPYVMLVNSSGKILSTCMQFDQLESRVARLKRGDSIQ